MECIQKSHVDDAVFCLMWAKHRDFKSADFFCGIVLFIRINLSKDYSDICHLKSLCDDKMFWCKSQNTAKLESYLELPDTASLHSASEMASTWMFLYCFWKCKTIFDEVYVTKSFQDSVFQT